MSEYFGPGVSRTLTAEQSFLSTVWQKRRPPSDSDLNLIQQLAQKGVQTSVRVNTPSGFLTDPLHSHRDIVTDPQWSNFFKLGSQQGQGQLLWAAVNGWLVPVATTRTGFNNDVDMSNVIVLDPPPTGSGQRRIDFVFLEVWQARLAPNPSTNNKPTAAGIYRFGNVEGGASYVVDDMVDPGIGIETNQRVQLQYRIRVVKDMLGLSANPDGFDALSVKAQGPQSTPTTLTFSNMSRELGDAGLWRAGDGTQNALGTVDGYVYAIPMAAVFRRNTVAWAGEPAPNLNGAINRNPSQTDRSGILGQPNLKVFSATASLSAALSATASTATVVSTVNVALPSTSTLIQIGDEVLSYSGISGTTLNGLVRGLNGTVAEAHPVGATIKLLSGRPDGLFADQIAPTDVLDLRKVVSPSGFDYTSLLEANLDKALRGRLTANWKRTDSGVQGTTLVYQDAIKSAGSSLGVTQLDAPDNIRTVFSDAAVVQTVEAIISPNTSVTASYTATNVSWSLGIVAGVVTQATANVFQAGDVLKVPVTQLKSGLQAGSGDQVTWSGNVELVFEGENSPLPAGHYTVTPITGPNDDLTITFTASMPVTSLKYLHIRAKAIYGAGRGLSRRPDVLHSISLLSPSVELLTENGSLKPAPLTLNSKFRDDTFLGRLPVTAAAYADLGSKTVSINPFRRITFPTMMTVDGNGANPLTAVKATRTGTLASSFGKIINVANTTLITVSDSLQTVFGHYTVTGIVPGVSVTVDRNIIANSGTSISFTVHASQGVMPVTDVTGNPKWNTTDPLQLFCNSIEDVGTGNTAEVKNMYCILPRHLVPGWGELHVPMQNSTTSSLFGYGYNFMASALPGASHTDPDRNFVPYTPRSSFTYAVFSTVDLSTVGHPTATYNTKYTYGGNALAGIRKFTDSRAMGRQGLELPPFYGPARLFAVYEAEDYATNGSSVDPATRAKLSSGGAVNLLRQSMAQEDGPAFWIEIDQDGDSTFILNSKALDLARSPNPIANFTAGNFVIEASIFGFDRGTFDPNQEARIVMTRPGVEAWTNVDGGTVTSKVRDQIVNKPVAGLVAVLPGPATISDQVLVNYSRTAYQGDAWGTQTTSVDVSYKPGPLLSTSAAAIHQGLTVGALTLPNQKPLEILASISFQTTLGTGRFSGDLAFTDMRFTAQENWNNSAPMVTSGSDPRPLLSQGGFSSRDSEFTVHGEYLGCTERLPLGAWFRDKDFRGQEFGKGSALVIGGSVGSGPATSLFQGIGSPLQSAESGVGAAGQTVVHVDGEQAAYTALTNFRTNRGGSIYMAGPQGGGALAFSPEPVSVEAQINTPVYINVLHGRAFLVRNAPTVVGASEVSAGGELMMLIVTGAQQAINAGKHFSWVELGANGQGEGYSAADLYRISGHPLDRTSPKGTLDLNQVRIQHRA